MTDTSDLELADLRGDVKLLLERTENLCDRLDEHGRMLRGALAQQGKHREATLEELHALERRCDERDEKLDRRIRALEQRGPTSTGLTKTQRNALIAILAAIASALGFGGGTAAKVIAGGEDKPPAQEAKP